MQVQNVGGTTIMFTDERFTALNKRFEWVKGQYLNLIEEKRNAAVKTVVSKGYICDVLPFENELYGYKLNGKILPKPVAHDDCHIYHLDSQDKVILIEDISTFSTKLDYSIGFYTLYTYNENIIERIYGNNTEPYQVKWAYSESGKIKETLCWAKEAHDIEVYNYDEAILKTIRHFQKQHKDNRESQFDLEFIYDGKSTLACIRRVWQNGYTQMDYSIKKINYKSLKQRLLTETEQAVVAFLQAHNVEHFTRFALDCYTGHGYVSLCMDTNSDEKYKDSPADWAYCDFASLPLIEFPMDDNQTEKVKKVVIQVAEDLLKAESLRKLTTDSAFKILVFDHNELLDEKP